jgi:hypothetical protein
MRGKFEHGPLNARSQIDDLNVSLLVAWLTAAIHAGFGMVCCHPEQ